MKPVIVTQVYLYSRSMEIENTKYLFTKVNSQSDL